MAMTSQAALDEPFRDAVAAMDAGDVERLERLLASHPELLSERADFGEGYFRRPYLLWFIAENPVRTGAMPKNVVAVARAIIEAARRAGVPSLREQLDYALGLVASGRVARESGAQLELIDALVDAGASPDAVRTALAHREMAAVEHLLHRGAPLSLAAAVCTGRWDDVPRLVRDADASDRQLALTAAAVAGSERALGVLIRSGANVDAYSPEGFHAHATPLHQAVSSGSLGAVRVLAEAGARLDIHDRIYHGTPLDWAEHLKRDEIAAYLRSRAGDAGKTSDLRTE